MKKRGVVFTVTLLIIMATGCATTRSTPEWIELQKMAYQQLGREVIWEHTDDERKYIEMKLEELFADGLTREEAVQAALINNAALQATFEEVGIARADLVQAGYFHNPSLEALFRFPENDEGVVIESGLFFRVSDIWQVPVRRKVADAEMKSTMMHVGQIILNTASRAQVLYDKVLYFEHMRKEMLDIVDIYRMIGDEVQVRKESGYTSDFEIYQSEVMVAEAEIEHAELESELKKAQAELNMVMGLGQLTDGYVLVDESSKREGKLPPLDEAIEYALDNRFDVKMARFAVQKAESVIRLEKAGIFDEVRVGLSHERESDGTNSLGPGVEMELPLFDQNRAQIAGARYMLMRAQRELEALEGMVQQEIRKDRENILLYRNKATILEERIIPLWQDALEYARRWVGAMQLNRLHLLEAQKELLQSRREYTEALLQLSLAYSSFQRNLGGSIPEIE
jgi:outer membrane protein TolC